MRHDWIAVIASVGALACGGTTPTEPDGGGATPDVGICTGDDQCDDHMFCDGMEVCMPTAGGADSHGCVHMAPTCMASQRCDEAADRCVTSCAVSADADADGVDATECGGTDCDDTDAMRHPGAVEVCDTANRDEDCDPSTFGTRDLDGDGFGDAACCNVDTGGAMHCGLDCNDVRLDSHPGATEACEGIDNDCDHAIDEGLLVPSWPDHDFDLHGDMTATQTDVCPGSPGFSTVNDDCDDTQATVYGAQLEICDGIDNDCDTRIDEAPVAIAWYPDADGDGFGTPSGSIDVSCTPVPGYSTRPSDCDDGDAMIHPGAHERCNGVDDDCNGFADASALGTGDTEDDDHDGFADRVCGGNDCDDTNGSVYPHAQEICNGIDDDCDTMVDGASANALWYLDLDRDGFGDASDTPIMSCDPQPGRIPRGGDCNDADASIHPGAADPCGGVDDDCDTNVDEGGVRFAYFPDADGDGWGTTDHSGLVFRCTPPLGTSARSGDCDDTDATRSPGALELCNVLDDDCDTTVDEDAERNWYADADMDGHGAGAATFSCTAPVGYVTTNDDCDDANATNFPGNPEVCNARDDDCDGLADDGADTTCMAVPHAATGTSCSSGSCSLSCASGFADCDGSVATGCEVDTRRSATFCGSCTNACNPGDSCGITTSGTCDRSPVVALDGYGYYTFAVRGTGGVAVWGGAGGYGVTLVGADAPVPAATQLLGIRQIDGGNEFACAVTTAGSVYCWGYGSAGQLGDGQYLTRNSPVRVSGITNAVHVSAGNSHACAVLATGAVMCWGTNGYGELGLGTMGGGQADPTAVPGIDDAVEVHAGNNHTCVRRGSAGIYRVSCWGDNAYGTLGIGTMGDRSASPVDIVGLPTNVIGMAHGGATDTYYVFTSDGLAYGWGYEGSDHALGLGSGAPPYATSPTLNTTLRGVVEIATDSNRGCARVRGAVAGTFEVWCWGSRSGLDWVDGVNTAYPVPMITAPPGTAITDATAISVGIDRWCAARASGGVVCMGSDYAGQLGDDLVQADVLTPVPVANLP